MRQLRLVIVFAAVVVGCYYVGFLTASFFKHGCSLAAACGRLPQATHDLLAALGYVAVGVAGLAAGLLALLPSYLISKRIFFHKKAAPPLIWLLDKSVLGTLPKRYYLL